MDKKSKYEEQTVLAQLAKKHDINIPRGGKNIQLLFGNMAKGDIGIKTRGKLDFLTNYCGYVASWTTKF